MAQLSSMRRRSHKPGRHGKPERAATEILLLYNITRKMRRPLIRALRRPCAALNDDDKADDSEPAGNELMVMKRFDRIN